MPTSATRRRLTAVDDDASSLVQQPYYSYAQTLQNRRLFGYTDVGLCPEATPLLKAESLYNTNPYARTPGVQYYLSADAPVFDYKLTRCDTDFIKPEGTGAYMLSVSAVLKKNLENISGTYISPGSGYASQILICKVCRTFFLMSQSIFCRDIPDLGIFSKSGRGVSLVGTLRLSDSDFEGKL